MKKDNNKEGKGEEKCVSVAVSAEYSPSVAVSAEYSPRAYIARDALHLRRNITILALHLTKGNGKSDEKL